MFKNYSSNSNINLFNIIIVIVILYLLYRDLTRKEGFGQAEDINNAINTRYGADVEAIRNLSNLATQLTTGGLTIPGNLKINGILDMNRTGDINNVKHINNVDSISFNNSEANNPDANIANGGNSLFFNNGANSWLFNNYKSDTKLIIRGWKNNSWSEAYFSLDQTGNLVIPGTITCKKLIQTAP